MFLIRATTETPTYKTDFVAKEDFCFTYYDGDAARDKAHMNRLQRGAYDDIISAQRKRGHLSIDDIKRVLSGDFDLCWPALEWVLKVDEQQKFFIEWVDKSIEKMRKHSEKQKEKVNVRWGKNKSNEYQNDTTVLPRYSNGIDPVIPLEDGNGNEDVIESVLEGGMGGTLEPICDEPFSIAPELPLPDTTLNAAERNQFSLKGNKNTDFLRKQWGVFIAERIHDPPERRRQFRQLSDLTSYFLNWVRNKHPSNAKSGTKQVGRHFEPD